MTDFQETWSGMPESVVSHASDDCGGCPLDEIIERRDFVRGALLAIGAMALLPGTARASALPVSFIRGTGARANKAYPFPQADGVTIDRDESVIIARFGGRVYAFSLACPHQNTAIRWDERHTRFQCPKHKSRYRPDGTFIEGRATRGLDRFAVRRDGPQLLVNFDLLYREDENAGDWVKAFVAVETTAG